MEKRYDVSQVIENQPKKKKSRGKKIILSMFIILVILIFAAAVFVMVYLNSLGINFIDRNNQNDIVNEDNRNDNFLIDDNLSDKEKDEYHGMITAVRDNSDLSATLKNWYTNGGDLMSSRDVLNVLIVGIDASGGTPMHGNSDVMMLASVNRKKGSITLCSFLRDSWTYFETSPGNGYYSKLNAAYANGGADCLINAIEQNYKIVIDYFVAVDFEAFEKVIDAIGGVNLDVEQFEAEAMEEYANISGVPYGENVKLNGNQALLFARMRTIYATGDVQRSLNQRKVINAIIKKSKTLGLSDLNNVAQTLCQYVYTDCPMTKIVSLGSNAILGKWYDYTVYSMEAPPESARKDYNGSTWMWIVDYPYSAQYVQKQIYGETNIVIQ